MTKEEIKFNGYGTWSNFGLTMLEREVNPAESRRSTLTLPQRSGVLDYSRKGNEKYYEERPLHFAFKRVIPSRSERERLRFNLMNFFEHHTDGVLIDTVEPKYYYKDATVVSTYFSDMRENLFIFQIDFMTYPYRVQKLREGHGVWDEIDFVHDVLQDTRFSILSMTEQLPFKELKKGDMVTLGGWAKYRRNQLAGEDPKIRQFEKEPFYEIVDKKETTYDPSKGLFSTFQYQLDNGYWILAQDIVQAREKWLDIRLVNQSSHAITPRITHRTFNDPSTWLGITIQRDNNFYNFVGDVPKQTEYRNDIFALNPGENNLRIYGQNNTIEFIWHKEVH